VSRFQRFARATGMSAIPPTASHLPNQLDRAFMRNPVANPEELAIDQLLNEPMVLALPTGQPPSKRQALVSSLVSDLGGARCLTEAPDSSSTKANTSSPTTKNPPPQPRSNAPHFAHSFP
jgi:hypothetical protein